MATTYHLGGYGCGKTFEALRLGIYNELVNGTRGICTNVALLQEAKVKGKTVSNKPGTGALNELLNRRFKNLDTRILQRVRILTEDEVPHFFCHRIARGGYHYDIPVPTEDEEKRGKRPDFSLLRDDGIVFVLDEFHDYFNSRLWAEVGRSVGWYKNQQRKLNDDIHACTPQIDEVDKQLRTIGHEYRVYNNLGLRKVRGIVMPRTFICTVYSSLDSVKRHGQPLNKYPFTLDVELANCYDTAKGVRGLQGGSADIGKRPKGIPWYVPLIGFILLIAAIIFFAFYVRGHFFGKRVRSPSVVVPAQTVKPVQNHAETNSDNQGLSQNLYDRMDSHPPDGHQSTEAAGVFCTGFTRQGYHVQVYLSDGRVADSLDGDVIAYSKHNVIVFGQTYPVKASYPSYVSEPVQTYDLPPALPRHVNEAEVTVIGDSYENRKPPQTLSGFGSMPQNAKPSFAPQGSATQ